MDGTYVGIKWNQKLGEELFNFFELPNRTYPEKCHTTLIYSRTYFKHKLTEDRFSAKIVGFRMFDKHLVLEIESPEITNRFEQILEDNKENEVASDFEQFIPHITISRDVMESDMSEYFTEEFLHKFKHHFEGKIFNGIEYTEKLELDWK